VAALIWARRAGEEIGAPSRGWIVDRDEKAGLGGEQSELSG